MVGVAWQEAGGLTVPCHQIGLAISLRAISPFDRLLGPTDQSLSGKSVAFTHAMTESLS